MIRGTGIDSTVKLYLKGNGADASTNFFDDSQSHNTITANGNAQISTAQSKFGGSSLYFDGDGDYFTVPGSLDFSFGLGMFYIGMWVYPTEIKLTRPIICSVINSTHLWVLRWGNTSENNLHFMIYNGGAVVNMEGAHGIIANTWNYISVMRGVGGVANNWGIYVNGSLVVSTTDADGFMDFTTTQVQIGADIGNNNYYYSGYIDDLQIIKGHIIDGTRVPTRQRG